MIAEVLGPVVGRIHPHMAEEVVGQMLAHGNMELLRLLRSEPELRARIDEVAHDLSWTSTVGAGSGGSVAAPVPAGLGGSGSESSFVVVGEVGKTDLLGPQASGICDIEVDHIGNSDADSA